jgi:5-methylcytosine-specific restriction endonuclease McrA
MRLISGGTDWYFHLWLNTVRIYRKRAEVKVILERDLRKHCPRPFFFDIGDRHVQAKMMFNLKGDAEKLIPFLKPHYVKLIEVMHPLLMPVIDKFSVHGTRAEVKTEVATRGRIAVKPVRTSRPDLVREYSRSVPPGWREEILIAFGHRCAHCGADLRQTEYHMDHIIPLSKEGTTTKKNLQPLCATCNLAKGNRHTG